MIAEDEANRTQDDATVREHLEKALFFAEKSIHVKDHALEHPLFNGMRTGDAPSENKQIVRRLKDELAWECFASFRQSAWVGETEARLSELA